MDPVEEFAALKAEVKRLEARLHQLRDGFVQPGARLRSNRHEVVVQWQCRRVFLRDRLPEAILADPGLWEQRISEIVTVRALAPPGRRKGGEDDIVLIE